MTTREKRLRAELSAAAEVRRGDPAPDLGAQSRFNHWSEALRKLVSETICTDGWTLDDWHHDQSQFEPSSVYRFSFCYERSIATDFKSPTRGWMRVSIPLHFDGAAPLDGELRRIDVEACRYRERADRLVDRVEEAT